FHRTRAELLQFVKRAPDDWIFVTFDHGSTASRVREYLADNVGSVQSLDDVSAALVMSSRTLSRRFTTERTSFQKIKDEMRRDLAVQRLVKTQNSVDEIASSVGFDNTPAFHRAFRTWTGSTPGAYRRQTDFRST
ncbi:hypothetical protein OY671_008951, partial [Metschnikowia pulcherrima]